MRLQELPAMHHHYDAMAPSITAWQQFLTPFNWRAYLEHNEPVKGGCGRVWEAPNFLKRENESFAFVEVFPYAEPHYHPTDSTEIYIVLEGKALVVIAGKEVWAKKDDVIVIEPNKAHFIIPEGPFILAIINIPAFKIENYIPLKESNAQVGFDKEKFEALLRKYT